MNFEHLIEDIRPHPLSQTMFVGLGNLSRGDDGAGLLLLEKLKKQSSFKNACFIDAGTTPENFLEEIIRTQPKLVIFIDASWWGGQPGEIAWLNESEIDNRQFSTHAYSLDIITQYLKKRANIKCKFLVIQPAQMDFAATVSATVTKEIEKFFV